MKVGSPSIGVVIVSYNTRELLRSCLESLRTCAWPLRIVVVDNASIDGSAALVGGCFPEVELLALERNVGFAAGSNLGVAHLLGPRDAEHTGTRRQGGRENGYRATHPRCPVSGLVLLLNPDTVVQPGAIEALAAFLEAHPRVGVVGPRLLYPDGSVQPAAFRFPTLAMTALDLFPPGEVLPGRLYNSWWHGRYPQEPTAAAPFPIDHPLGACMLTRRAVLEEVGLFDEGFFMYAEEVEWCRRVRAAGWAIWQEPRARVVHVGGASTRQAPARMQIALYRSRMRYLRTWEPPGVVRLHRLIIRAGMLRAALRAWRGYLRGALSRDEVRERLWAYGTIMRYSGQPAELASEESGGRCRLHSER
jgi:GT2 family glycosyltransferase